MWRSAKHFTGALCLIIGTSAFSGAARADTAGDPVRPAPVERSAGASKTGNMGKILNADARAGDVLRVVNVAPTAGDGTSADGASRNDQDQAQKPAARKSEKTRKTAKSKSRAAGAGTGSAKYSDLIRAAAKKHGVPIKIAKAVVQVESNFNSRARGRAGEVGLMQIKPATARGLGYRGSVKALYDPKTNLEWGMRYLAGAHVRANGDLCGTILRYNAGHFAKRMNPISRRYCQKVKTILAAT